MGSLTRLGMGRLFFVLTFLLISVTYYLHLPVAVQAGDSGELVTAAAQLFVPHPPGFPLFLWLQAAWIRLVSGPSVFWEASLLSAVFSLGTLFLLARTMRALSWDRAVLMASLAFSPIYWKFSELPDVFALNALAAALIVYFYLHSNRAKWVCIPFVFCVGLANHPTLVFLFPIVLHVLWAGRRQKSNWISLAVGAGLFVGLMLSLFLLKTEAMSSWGELKTFNDLLNHLLRQDYGWFQLTADAAQASFSDNFAHFAQRSWGLLVILLATGFLYFPSLFKMSVRQKMLLLTTVLYLVVFLSRSNVNLLGYGAEILDRFLILPQVLMAFWLADFLRDRLENRWLSLRGGIVFSLLILLAGHSYWKHKKETNFSQNTIAEDYALNFLNQAPLDRPTVLILDSDTRVFAVRYVQEVLKIRPDVNLVSPATLAYPWYQEKLVRSSQLQFNLNRNPGKVYLLEELILPNLENFVFLTNLSFLPNEKYQLNFLPLGRSLEKVGGESLFRNPPLLKWRSGPEVIGTDPRQYDSYRDLWRDSSYYDLWKATVAPLDVDVRPEMNRLLQRIPWCWPAQSLICQRLQGIEKSQCEMKALEIKSENFNYYQ